MTFWIIIAIGALLLSYAKYSKPGKLAALKTAFVGSVADDLDKQHFDELYGFFLVLIQGGLAGSVISFLVASPYWVRMVDSRGNFYLAVFAAICIPLSRISFEFWNTFYKYFQK